MTLFGIDMDTPFESLTEEEQNSILYDSGEREPHFHYINDSGGERNIDLSFKGVVNSINRCYHETNSDFTRNTMRGYMNELLYVTCHGYRLNNQALYVRAGGKNDLNIRQASNLSVADRSELLIHLELSEDERTTAAPIVKEIKDRLTFLNNIDLNYSTLLRSAGILSGGESQRIRLATQVGLNLSGVLYILDKSSIRPRQRDNDRLILGLKKMRDLGNILIVVEHDEDTMCQADWLINAGPGAGDFGEQIVTSGTLENVAKNKKSVTGRYLSGIKEIPVSLERCERNGRVLRAKGTSENDLQDIGVIFLLGRSIAVTGVSGSGRSTSVSSILKKAITQKLNRDSAKPGKHKALGGIENIERLIDIDQSPIGHTPRSNPATYTSAFDNIRDLFAKTSEAKIRGYKKERFSFSAKGGRCEACSGNGIIKTEMHSSSDVYVPCEVCHGTRYNSETLRVHYKDENIVEILDMMVNDTCLLYIFPSPRDNDSDAC